MIITVASLKGGVGKSTVALNTAYGLSTKYKVLLIDSDPQNSISSFLCTDFSKGFSEVLFGDVALKDVIIKPYLDNNNFFIIPTGLKSLRYTEKYEELFDSERFKEVVNQIKELPFDFVLFDTPPRISKQNETLLKNSDYFFIIVNPDPASYASFYLFLEFLKENNLENFYVVVNKVEATEIAEEFSLAIKHKSSNRIIAFVPSDIVVTESEGKCEPAIKRNPSSAFSLSIRELIDKFLKILS